MNHYLFSDQPSKNGNRIHNLQHPGHHPLVSDLLLRLPELLLEPPEDFRRKQVRPRNGQHNGENACDSKLFKTRRPNDAPLINRVRYLVEHRFSHPVLRDNFTLVRFDVLFDLPGLFYSRGRRCANCCDFDNFY